MVLAAADGLAYLDRYVWVPVGVKIGMSPRLTVVLPEFQHQHSELCHPRTFVLTWIVALSIWQFGHIEQPWDAAAAKARAAASTGDSP